MRIVIDSSVLIYLVQPNAGAPTDDSTGKPVEHCQQRIEGFLEELDKSGAELIIPTPVLSELLIRAGNKKQEILAALSGRRAVVVAPFDERAAIENAMLRRTPAMLKGGGTKNEVKFDLQIMAIARTNSVSIIYTDDGGLRARCVASGIETRGIADLPLQPSKQQIPMDLPAQPGE